MIYDFLRIHFSEKGINVTNFMISTAFPKADLTNMEATVLDLVRSKFIFYFVLFCFDLFYFVLIYFVLFCFDLFCFVLSINLTSSIFHEISIF